MPRKLAVAGVGLLLTAATLQSVSQPRIPPDFGTVPEAAVVLRAASASGTSPGAGTRVGVNAGGGKVLSGGPVTSGDPGSAGDPSRASRSSRRGVQPAGGASSVRVPAGKTAPTSLSLTGHGAAPVVPVGDRAGRLDVPDRVSTVGWWVGGAGLEATAGSIVVVGHVDAAGQGNGYLSALRQVAAGDKVSVTGADGSVHRFVVTGRRAYRKAQGLPPTVFDQAVQIRLVLITCTGAFDPVARRYEDNLVVYAVPAG